MMRIFIDTNVLLDLILKREPNYTSIAQVSESIIRATLGNICNTCEIVALTSTVTMRSLVSAFPDFEDATQYFCALENGCNVILTYNKKDFVHSTIPILTTAEFLVGYK
jgi:predicted nucleic acid-binding protein